MVASSPTPVGTGPVRRASQRQRALRRLPSRTDLARNEGQLLAAGTTPSRGTSNSNNINSSSGSSSQAHHHHHQQQFHHDSSEDEIPVPMKLSALTKALLNDGGPDPVERPPSALRQTRRVSQLSASHDQSFSRSAHAQPADASRASRPPSSEASPVRKRVVRLSNTPQSLSQLKRRSTSTSRTSGPQRLARPSSRADARERSGDERPASQQRGRLDINTPARPERVVRIVSGSSARRSRIASAVSSSGPSNHDRSALEAEPDQADAPETAARPSVAASQGSGSRYPSTRSRSGDNANLQSSMRVKRVGKIPGSFLSGPARRGRRRQSEEDADVNGDGDGVLPSHEPELPMAHNAPNASYYADGIRDFNSGSPVSGGAAARAIQRRQAPDADLHAPGSARPPSRNEAREPLRIDMPAALDQENQNQMSVSYKPPKAAPKHALDRLSRQPADAQLDAPKAASPERKPLAVLANNTPRRPAPPPPPKMSVLEAATSTAGAAATTTQAKQRRNVLRVNGKCYTRLDCLGRGGSAKVYRVTAENGNMFALKRVSLENADEATVRGYKGEIDLLGRLAGVDRVIKLFDHEMNSEKQVLTLLMEMGELDLNKLLTSRQNPEQSRFDPVFVRFYWKEMLECLQSVHQYDIVHSDLKPANFVLVRGRLKLIDFGIANAIQTDETVNVHRETQIGTPNYMSPESLMDANNPRGGGRLPGRPRLMKLGKPSDVWSLGCILYQMVYGLPPYGHIANQMARCQAIINWDHHVEFPSRAMGGVPVPPSLLRTMRRCLDRDQHMRPTCDELLHDTDPFLYPVELGDAALPIDEELLARIISSVVTRCRDRMPTEAESVTVWPQAYWASIKKAMAGRT